MKRAKMMLGIAMVVSASALTCGCGNKDDSDKPMSKQERPSNGAPSLANPVPAGSNTK